MSKLTDHQLLEMLRSFEEIVKNKALTMLYRENYHGVEAFVKKNNGRIADAEDVFQDGLLAFYEQVINGSFKETSTIKTYLYAICKNIWYKRLRKSSTKNESYGMEIEMAQKEALTLDIIIADEESESLALLLNKIGADCKKVLLLYYYERKRMKEIAKILSLANEQVAKNKKNRCLNKLKDLAISMPHFKPFYKS